MTATPAAPAAPATPAEITALRAAATSVRNTALARLCSDALAGDPEATARVISIMRTGNDLPATGDRAARIAALRAANGL